jgi:hypothetical protein
MVAAHLCGFGKGGIHADGVGVFIFASSAEGWTQSQLTRACKRKAVTADLAILTFTNNIKAGPL